MTDYPIPSNVYLNFDGNSIKELIRTRLNQTGIFTDQNFEGSNLSALNDVFGMIGSLFLYNISKSISEGSFDDSKLYENVNKTVKQLDYNPIGHQTATMAFSLSATTLSAGNYVIPRYSYITIGGIRYSLSKDFSFFKTADIVSETIDVSEKDNILYQGIFHPFPMLDAAGNDYELIYLTVDDKEIVDNFNIHVYVKDSTGIWKPWTKTHSLYLNGATDEVFELRFNANKRYELKFGNNITGKKLSAGDKVAIFYLKSDGVNGELGANVLNSRKIVTLDSPILADILQDVSTDVFMTTTSMDSLTLNNPSKSSFYSEPETVQQIKQNAPGAFRSQYSLVTSNNYETFIRSNFANIIHDVKCVSNSQYLNSYQKYFYDLGLTNPAAESRALFNQFKMADACNFNNVYLFVVPKTMNDTLSYISPAQKSLIVNSMTEEKILTSETVLMDPVYMALDFIVPKSNIYDVNDINQSGLGIVKQSTTRRNDSSIISEVANIIQSFFSRVNNTLGQLINLNQLMSDILAVDGVKQIYTIRLDGTTTVEGIQLAMFNPIYNKHITVISGNRQLDDFQYPYLYTSDIINKIKVIR